MLNHQSLFELLQKNLQTESFFQNAFMLNSWEKNSCYRDFEASAKFCTQALKKAGFSDVRSIAHVCDGVRSAMDHTMPQAWDRSGRCTLKIISPGIPDEKRLLCDSDRHPLEAGIWSPSTPPEGLTGEIVNGDELDENSTAVAGKFVYSSEPPKNKRLRAWSHAGALGLICSKMEAKDVAPDELCWMNGAGHYGWYYSRDDKRIPIFVLTPRRAEFLMSLLKKGPVTVCGVMNTRIYDGTIRTVTGRIPGESPEELLLIAHIYEPFVADDAVGFAGCVEIGRLLKQLSDEGKLRLKRSLLVVFTMERYGLYAFFSNRKRTANIFAAQNLDAFCSKTYRIGRMPLNFFMSPVCNPFFGDVLQKKLLDTLLPDLKYIQRHSVLHDDSLGGDPHLDIPTLWIEGGTGIYHHTTSEAFNEIDEELAPPLLALLATYTAEMLSLDVAELRKKVTPYILDFYRERVQEVRKAFCQGVIDAREAGYRLYLARHFAEGRLRSFNKLQKDLVRESYIQTAVTPVAAEWTPPAAPMPDLSPMEARADNMVLQRRQWACMPFSLSRVPLEERKFWPQATNRLLLPLSDGHRSLLEALRMQRYTENIPVKPFMKEELKGYIDFFEYLAKYGYVKIHYPRKTRAREFSSALSELGVRKGMRLIVHSSMAAFGHFEGGAKRFCRELQKAVGTSGTLMMPAFNQYDMTDTNGVFDWRNTTSKVGMAAECFRKMPGVIRSLDPTHSLAVWGKDKIHFVQHHHQLPTMHQNSPIGLLEQADGYCLMVACYTAVTFMHIVETSNGALCCGQRSEEYDAILPDGTKAKLRAWAWRDGKCRALRHQEIYGWLKKHHKMTEIMVGNAHLRLFKLADYRRAYERLLHGKEGCRGCTVKPRKNAFSIPGDWDLERDCLKTETSAFVGDVDFSKYL